MPNPNPTATQIETTREVLALKSYSETSGLIGDLDDAQWAAQIADNALWAAKRNKFVELRGGGVFIDPKSPLGRIRNRSRLRFGLSALQGEASDADAESAEGGLVSSLSWF